MLTRPHRSPRRRSPITRSRTSRFLGSLALAATAALVAGPTAGAQSTLEADGAITFSSLGDTFGLPAASSGLTGSLASVPYDEYVALGDSYAALGDNTAPAGGPEGCARSLGNYPHQLDQTDMRVGELTDVTCGGAVVADLTEPQLSDAPPQFDALDDTTDLVTLSIGGNDVGFGKIVLCITKKAPFATVPDCEAAIGDDVSADIAALYGQDGPVDDAYDAIAGASPDATVIATQYMPLMPADGISCAFTDQLNPADVAWARGITEDINDAVDAAATRNGHVSVMPTDTVDRSACAAPDQRWTSFLGTGDNTAPMHPTALGQKAMASAVSAAL